MQCLVFGRRTASRLTYNDTMMGEHEKAGLKSPPDRENVTVYNTQERTADDEALREAAKILPGARLKLKEECDKSNDRAKNWGKRKNKKVPYWALVGYTDGDRELPRNKIVSAIWDKRKGGIQSKIEGTSCAFTKLDSEYAGHVLFAWRIAQGMQV